MWNITPDNLKLIKEELKGRRAAIEARYAEELKALAADLEEIETLERVAYAFAVKHLSDATAAGAANEPVAQLAALEPDTAEPPAMDTEAEPQAEAKGGGTSRWRLRTNMADA
jgi:hypothetical protein